MGTNYYLKGREACPCCGRASTDRHIGKSSAGWVFALHVYPEEGINDLPAWYDLWSAPGAVIEDEYGKTVSANEMVSVVLARFGMRKQKDHDDSFYTINQAVRGPYGLARARNAIAGLGTYALHTGDFS